jgi:tetratricopeptide (TPR) repeat protein
MHSWQRKIKRGIHLLSRHDADRALEFFRQALEECPVSQTREMARLLFYMGIALKRLGCMSGAIRSWLSSLKLTKDRYALKMIKRFTNCYGMERQGTEELDDWRAFYSIQLARYLNSKRNRRFSSDAERDMVNDLITEHWARLVAQRCLENRTPEEKNRIFRAVKIIFPFVILPNKRENSIIQVDFRWRRRIEAQDRCFCGSGLPFLACCGRIPRQTGITSVDF